MLVEFFNNKKIERCDDLIRKIPSKQVIDIIFNQIRYIIMAGYSKFIIIHIEEIEF
ncbi:hypothetical protein [uncultured Methanobrevibacter sp.]|uniref:hypothetical protein n=1 Tax=uncultured Methanobrevibacter sp. TaxID=253161 RepID=UPI002621F7DB|nr:hypothetical protein [uncultured Methanobrevibacter sp.]